MAESHQFEDLRGRRFRIGPISGHPAVDLGRHQHVFEDRQRTEDFQPLERPGDPEPSPAMRAHALQVGSIEDHPPVGHTLEPADDVEGGCLAGPVGTDKPGHRSRVDSDIDAPKSGDASESHLDISNFKQSHDLPPCTMVRAPKPAYCYPLSVS